MPDDIERTIFKLEIDGTAYAEGADKIVNSTNNMAKAQEEANRKLKEFQSQQATYKKSLAEVEVLLKENAKETIELSKDLNRFKEAEVKAATEAKNLEVRLKALGAKGGPEFTTLTRQLDALKKAQIENSGQAKILQTQLKAVATNSKELQLEATGLKSKLGDVTKSITTQTKEVETLGKSSVNITKLYSGFRTLANIIPGVGISGLISLIAGPLIDATEAWIESLHKTSDAMKLIQLNQANVNEVMEEADKAAGKQIVDLEILYRTATNVNISLDERKKAVVALQKEFPDYFGNIKAETILNGQATTQYDLLSQSILKAARATAAKSKLDQLAAQQLDVAFSKEKTINATNRELDKASKLEGKTTAIAGVVTVTSAADEQKAEAAVIKFRRDKRLAELADQEKSLKQQEDFLIKFAGLTDIAHVIEDADTKKFKDKKEKQTKEIENIYEQELQKLRADIAKLDSKAVTTEASITASIEADFKIRSAAFDKALQDKKLTPDQLKSLQGYLKNLQKLTLDAQLKSFREEKATYLKSISDELFALQFEESSKRIQTIQNGFQRERETIILETDRTVKSLEEKRDKRINDIINSNVGLTPAEIKLQTDQIKLSYSKLIDDLILIKNQKLQQLAFDTFEALTTEAKRTLDFENLGISQGSLFRIQEQSKLLSEGKVSYQEYQKALTQIARDEAHERFIIEERFLKAEIKIRSLKLANDKTLTDDQIIKLKDEIRKLEQELADAQKGDIIGGNKDDGTKKKLDTVSKYAVAIGSVIESVISFWQKANEAEQKALDRSIALQEKRVDAAQRIADRGNAQYLKGEVDRLNELNVARENAARKQLGIDAALQASQVLVGITGAISKIATPGIGTAEVIADIGLIIGALATGYGLVKSLQNNQPKFFVGTKSLELGGNPIGRDTIPVMAHQGEAIIPTATNNEYRQTVAAVYDKTVPAKDLNQFVVDYHKNGKTGQPVIPNGPTYVIRPVPQFNFEKIKESTEDKISHDTKIHQVMIEQNKLIKENTEYQKQAIKAIKSIGLSVNLDRNGFAMSMMEAVKQIEIDKRI